MRASAASSQELLGPGCRLDASYHASVGVEALRFVRQWAGQSRGPAAEIAGIMPQGRSLHTTRRPDKLADVCVPGGVFIPSRFTRIFVDDAKHGTPYVTGTFITRADPLAGAKLLSRRFTRNTDQLALRERMIIVTCSGTIGDSVYVNANLQGVVGSPDLLRIVADAQKIAPGYLYCFVSSPLGRALIRRQTYGAVVPHIEAHHVTDMPVPRLDSATEVRIHALIEKSAFLRAVANRTLARTKERFLQEALGLSPSDCKWRFRDEHAYAIGAAKLASNRRRLDAFHYIGYVHEAATVLKFTACLGDLVEAFQPPIFKRPYTNETGIPFLSGMDLYNTYPRPRTYISRRMKDLDRYIVKAGTILVQNVGQRYGVFGRPIILPRHLDHVAVTQHLTRLHLRDPRDRGFVFAWLSTEFGRRLLLRESFGTSMGVLFEHCFEDMPVPACTPDLRHTFEADVGRICHYRELANQLEDRAHTLLDTTIGMSWPMGKRWQD